MVERLGSWVGGVFLGWITDVPNVKGLWVCRQLMRSHEASGASLKKSLRFITGRSSIAVRSS